MFLFILYNIAAGSPAVRSAPECTSRGHAPAGMHGGPIATSARVTPDAATASARLGNAR